MLRGFVLIGAFAIVNSQGGVCDKAESCTYDVQVNGKVQSLNFRGLCNPGQDYSLDDGAYGHVYKAQICGLAGSSCLPRYYNSLYQYGAFGPLPDK